MALSYYPKFEYEASSFQEPQSELSMELQAFQNTSDYFNYSIEPLFDHHQPQQDFIFQEIDNFYTDPLIPCFSDGLLYPIPPPPPLFPQFSSEFDVPLFDHGFPPAPAYFIPGRVDTGYEAEEKRMSGGGGGGKTVSGQSIAARQRRKKIAERTQELGKLIPGGQKMNTAEMFQAAFHYVKFLQAQIAILQFMTTNIQSEEEEEEEEHGEEEFQMLQSLVSSPMVQEKLSSARKCLVPQQFVQTLANDIEIQSNNPNISEQIHQLLLINYNNSSS